MADAAGPAMPGADVVADTAADMVEAIRDGRLDEAEVLLAALRPYAADPGRFLLFPIVIAIQRGQVIEALRTLDGWEPRHAAPLQALCLHLIGDPTWEGKAREVLDSDDALPHVRRAMRQLCGLPELMPARASGLPAPSA
jgi:hypothetical protein